MLIKNSHTLNSIGRGFFEDPCHFPPVIRNPSFDTLNRNLPTRLRLGYRFTAWRRFVYPRMHCNREARPVDGGLAFPDYVTKRRRPSLLNCCQILRLIRIVIFVELSRTAMRCQAKLLTSSPQIVLKKSCLSILVNYEF